MALVASPIWSVAYSFRDNNDNVGTVHVYFPGDLLMAELQTSASALGGHLAGVSNAALTGYSIVRVVTEDAPVVPPPESEVERKLRIPLGTSTIPNASSIEVPSPVFGMEVAGTDVVNPAYPQLGLLLDFLTAGLALPGNGITDARGVDITRHGAPVIMHRNRRPRR